MSTGCRGVCLLQSLDVRAVIIVLQQTVLAGVFMKTLSTLSIAQCAKNTTACFAR